MQHSPTEIKDKLLKALDKEYNVVDMAAVFEIVSILERTPITKEALEATRLGKYINELRRKTTNESLAKRAKDLVRRWRNLISRPPETNSQLTNHTNGSRTISPSIRPSPISPSLRSNPNLSPSLVIGSSLTSPALSSTYGSKNRTVLSPTISIVSDKSTSPRLTNLSQSSAIRNIKSNAIRSRVDQAAINSGIHGLDSVPRTHAANKRLRKDSGGGDEPLAKVSRLNGMTTVCKKSNVSTVDVFGECSRDSFGLLSDKSGSVVEIPPPVKVPVPEPKVPKKRGRKKGSTKEALNAARNLAAKTDDIVITRIASIARNPKVKTTQELLAGLQAKSSGGQDAAVAVSTSEKPPSLPNSVISSRGSALDALEISRNKTEHIARFLRSQSELQSSDMDPHYSEEKTNLESLKNVLACNVSNSKDYEVNSELRSISRLDQSGVDDAFVSSTPSQSVANIVNTNPDQTVEEILSRLPPLLQPDEIVWSSSESESEVERLKSEKVVTDSDVVKLHSEHWPNVNGIPNDGAKSGETDDGFREWHETVSRSSYKGELLHILPYVVID